MFIAQADQSSVSVLLTIAFRIANFDAARMSRLADAMNIAQMSAISTSLISNLSSMGVVGATLWFVLRALE
jgi:hypothetical protein